MRGSKEYKDPGSPNIRTDDEGRRLQQQRTESGQVAQAKLNSVASVAGLGTER